MFKRVLLLSGCQTLTKNPIDLYPIMRILRPDYVPDQKIQFFERYCDPVYKEDKGIIEFLGTSHETELEMLFDKRIAIKYSEPNEKIQKNSRIRIEIDGNFVLQD